MWAYWRSLLMPLVNTRRSPTTRCVLTTYRDPQRVRDTVWIGTEPTPPVSAWGTHSHRREPRVRAMPVGRARWGTCGDQRSDSPVNQSAPTVAFYRRRWLPTGYSSANSGKREQSAFSVSSRHVSVRRSACLGSSQDANANFGGLWLTGEDSTTGKREPSVPGTTRVGLACCKALRDPDQ